MLAKHIDVIVGRVTSNLTTNLVMSLTLTVLLANMIDAVARILIHWTQCVESAGSSSHSINDVQNNNGGNWR